MAKKIIKTPPLQDYQSVLFHNLIAHREDSIHVVKSPRQMGKSFLIEMLLLAASVNHPKQTSIVIQPTLAQSRKMAKQIYNLIKDIPIFESYNSTLLEIHFWNGSEIIFKSDEQRDAIRGYTITKFGLLVVDEAAYISDDTFYSSMPLCNANKAPILIFSTPRWKSGFFYEFYTKGENNEKNIYSYDWSKFTNPFLTPEKLEMVRKSMSINLFRADYLCRWMENNSMIFGDFEKIMNNSATLDNNYVMSIDWGSGKGGDYTAVSVMNSIRQQVYVKYWNDLDETNSIKKIIEIVDHFRPKKLSVEINSIGSIFLNLLKKELIKCNINVAICEINLTNKIKSEMYNEFIVAVQNRTIQLLDDRETRLEMTALQQQRTPKGLITYNASSGYHDDVLDTVCYNLYMMRQAHYVIS